MKKSASSLTTELVEGDQYLSLFDLCQSCALPAEQIILMVEYGVINPVERNKSFSHWSFSTNSLLRMQTALRLQRDLELNLPGTILALELLDEIKTLRKHVAYLQRS